MEYKKFNLYEPLLNAICSMDDSDAGKFIKLLYGYIFDNINSEDIFGKRKKGWVELTFFAKKAFIDSIKSEKKPKKGIKYITFYSWYTELFDLINDGEAGRLIKKLSDEELKTEYLKNNKNALEITKNYDMLMEIYNQYRSEYYHNKALTHDFSKIKEDFPYINWNDFNIKKEPFKSVNCIELYDYMKENHMENEHYNIEAVIEMFNG